VIKEAAIALAALVIVLRLCGVRRLHFLGQGFSVEFQPVSPRKPKKKPPEIDPNRQ